MKRRFRKRAEARERELFAKRRRRELDRHDYWAEWLKDWLFVRERRIQRYVSPEAWV